MKDNKYKGLAEYLVKHDQYLALNIEQAKELVRIVKAFFKTEQKRVVDLALNHKPATKVDILDPKSLDIAMEKIISSIRKLESTSKKKVKPFVGTKYACKLCKSVIQSRYSGDWAGCACGKSYVDQSEYYTRCGGEVEHYDNKSKKKGK